MRLGFRLIVLHRMPVVDTVRVFALAVPRYAAARRTAARIIGCSADVTHALLSDACGTQLVQEINCTVLPERRW